MTESEHAMVIAERVYGVAGLIGLDPDKLGRKTARADKIEISEMMSQNSSMEQIEAIGVIEDWEDKVLEGWEGEMPNWALELMAHEFLMDAMLAELNKQEVSEVHD